MLHMVAKIVEQRVKQRVVARVRLLRVVAGGRHSRGAAAGCLISGRQRYRLACTHPSGVDGHLSTASVTCMAAGRWPATVQPRPP
jgi:hypothetical protein